MATQTEIQQALQQPYDQKRFAAEVLKPVFGSTFSYAHAPSKPTILPTASEQAVIHEVLIYGSVSLEDGTEITCYQILLQPTVRIEQSRVAIQQYVRKLITAGDAALINFISPNSKDNWRFTLVASDTQLGDEGIEEVKTNPKRYTYLIEKERHNRTMADRMSALSLDSDITLQSLIKAFSVEAMSKAFFNEYKEHYQNFVEYITGKRMVKVKGKWTEQETGQPHAYLKSLFNGNEKDARDFIKKLMGRIVFLYFVQKKRWLGASTTDYTDGPYDFIAKLFEETGGNKNFFPIGLSELFFNALNNERPNDDWKMPSGKTVKIPYLNGGLFDRDEIDEKIHKKGDMLTFPPGLFSHVDKQDTPIERGFLDFLNAYNFTVYEDSEDDHTIAVDPEMLGHIFENLLEDNKDKGAFYTPKEIVHYMCQESLVEYLSTHLEKEYKVYRQLGKNQVELFGNEVKTGQLSMMEELGDKALDRSEVEHMVKEKDIRNLTDAQLNRIDELLDEVKVCDPAIGSGAFPMGLLQEIFTIKEAIALKRQKSFEAADVKEHIISNSIYGVDIERGAVDIARLRFWLSLVVDENQPKTLPNLDYKIVVGDSLLSKFNGEVVEIDWERKKTTASTKSIVASIQKGLKEITQKQQQFFDPTIADKSKLKLEIRNLKLDVLINQVSLNKVEYANTTLEKGGFAPTAKEQIHNTERKLKIAGYNQTLEKLKTLKENPLRPFQHFDWKLDFPEVMNELVVGEQRGFDIVIGNPPYLQLQKMGAEADTLQQAGFQTYARTGDVYCLFYERGINILKIGGILSYITSNSWLQTSYGKPLRKFFAVEANPLTLINFEDTQLFETAIVEANILNIQKSKFSEPLNALRLDSRFDSGTKIHDALLSKGVAISELSEDGWAISDPETQALKLKMEANGKKLEDWDVVINYGIKTGFNKAFVIDGETRDKLIAADPKNEKLIKPTLRGKDLRRYSYSFADRWIIFIPWHFPLHDDENISGASVEAERTLNKKYPALAAHLNSFKNQLSGRNQSETGIRYEWYVLQRWAASYWRDFEKPKIVWGELSNQAKFTFDDESHYVEATLFLMVGNNLKYLLGILNSRAGQWFFEQISTTSGMGTNRWKKYKIINLPAPVPSSDHEKTLESKVTQILALKKKGNDTTTLEREIDLMVYKLYDLTWEEACLIEESEEWMEKGEYEGYELKK